MSSEWYDIYSEFRSNATNEILNRQVEKEVEVLNPLAIIVDGKVDHYIYNPNNKINTSFDASLPMTILEKENGRKRKRAI